MKTFTVVYRTGGKENTVWKRSLPFTVRQDAERTKRQIEMAGRKALLFDTDQLNNRGMPEGWDNSYEN